ncbi:uncharacterized protein LOC144922159 [Branchiostoma floridae x Branchiostoma belcheri]
MQRGNNEPNQDPRGHIPPQPPPLLSMLESFTELHHQQGPRVWHSPSDSTNNFVSAQPGNSRSSDSSRFFQESVEMTPQQSQQTRDGPTQGEPATLPAHVNLILSKFMNQGTSRHHHQPQTSLRKRKFRGYHDNPRDNCVDFFDVTVTKCSVGKEALRQLDIHPSTIMRNASGSERQPLTTTDTLDCPHLKAALFGNANGTSDVPPQSRQYSYKADSVGVTCDPTASDYSQYAYDCPEWSQNANTRVPNHVQVPPDRLHTGQAVRRTGTPELQMTVSSLSNSPTTTEEDPLDLSRKKRPGHEIWSDNGQVSEKTTPESDSNNIQFMNNGEERKDDNTQPQHVPDAVFVSEPYMHANTENTLPAVDLSRNNFKPTNNGLQRLRGESSSKPIQHHGSKTSGQRSHPSASSFATLVGNQHPNEPDANIKAGCPPQQGIHGPKQGSVLPGYPGNPYQSPGWRQPAGLHVRPPPGLLIQAPSNPKPSNKSHPEVAMRGSYAYGQHPNIPYGHPINQQVPNQAYPPLPPDRFQSASPYVRGRAPNSYPSASPVYYPHNTTALSSSVQPRPMWSNPHYAEAPSKPFDKPLQSGPRPLQEQHARTATQAPLPQSWYPSSSLQPLQHSVRPELHVARGRGQVAPGAQWPSQPQPEDSRIIQPSPVHNAKRFRTRVRVHDAKTAFGRTDDYVTSTTVIIFSTIRWTTVTIQSIAFTLFGTIITIVSTTVTITGTTVTIIYGTVHHRLHGTVTIIQTTDTIISTTVTNQSIAVIVICTINTIVSTKATITWTTVTIIYGTVHGTVTIIQTTVTITHITITHSTVTIIRTTVTIICGTVTIASITVTITHSTVTIIHGTVTIIHSTVTITHATVTIIHVTITHSTVTIIRTTVTIICGTVTIASITVTITHSTVTIIHGTVTIIHSTVTITHATVTIIHGTVTIIHSTVTIIHTTVTIIHTTVTIIHATVTIIHDSADSKAAEMPLLLAFLNSAPVHKATKSATPKQVPQDKHQQSPPSGNKPQGSSSGVINDIEELRSLLLEENAEDGEEFPTSRQSRDVGPCNYKNPQLAYYWDCLQTTLPSPFDKNPAYDRWNTYNGWHTYNTYTGMREQRGPTKRRQAGHPADNMVLKKRQMRSCLDQLENRHRCESTDTDGGNSRNADTLNRVNGWRAREQVMMAMPRQGMEAVNSPRELTCTSSLQRLEGPALLMANRIRLVQEKPLRPPPPLIKIKQT